MDFTVLNHFFENFGSFLAYFAVGLILLALFTYIYEKFTPYQEFKLINIGNKAAGVSLFGAMLGFCLPMASCVVHTVNIVEMVVWGFATGLFQLLAFTFIKSFLVKNIKEQIEKENVAVAMLCFAVSICVGLLNAASISY